MSGVDPIRRIASVEGRAARLNLWAETVRACNAVEATGLLDALVRRASVRDPNAITAYLPLLDLPTFTELAGPGRLASVIVAAQEVGNEGCLLLLEHPGPSSARQHIGPPPDPAIEVLTLGHRKTVARSRRSPMLERVLKDPDPRVVAEMLRNPRLRESEVLAVASRRPCPEEVFWMLTRAERWIRRSTVRRAIALNPYSPPQLAGALVVLLPEPDLVDIAQDEGLHFAVRSGALLVLKWRREARPEE